MNQYFKEKRGINIINNEHFIQGNEMFKDVTKQGRREGRGSIENKNPINAEDMKKVCNYFTKNMQGSPNAKLLQEVVLFNNIYFMGCIGRENLRSMNKQTFKIAKDQDRCK